MAKFPCGKDQFMACKQQWAEETKSLSPRAKAAWADLRYELMDERNKGVVTQPATAYARRIAASEKGTEAVLAELAACGVVQVTHHQNGDVTLVYQRALDAYKTLEANKLRVGKHRAKLRGNDVVWTESNQWLNKYLQEQQILVFPVGVDFFDPIWWERISVACGMLSKKFLDSEFSKIANWIETPGKLPPAEKQRNGLPNTGGWKNFIGGWLVRAYERQRRYGTGNAEIIKKSAGQRTLENIQRLHKNAG